MAATKYGKANIAPQPEPQQKFSIVPKVINGGLGGMVGITTVFPMDLVKTRLQNQVITPEGVKQYNSIIDCFVKIFKQEGFFGMYRGLAVNALLMTPEKAVKLSANDVFRYYLALPDGSLPISRQIVAGGLAGICAGCSFSTPMELLKIQLQDAGRVAAQQAEKGVKIATKITALAVAKNIVKTQGFFGLYRGVGPTTLREFVFCIIYFPLFTMLNKAISPDPNKPPFWCSFICGLSCGALASVSVTPIDVVKTRMQTIVKGKGERQYKSILECFILTYKNEGMKALFKGGACRMMVIAPVFAIAQTIYYFQVAEKLLGIENKIM